MSDTKTKTVHSGISFASLLAITFIVLKLTGYIEWNWWWVLSPLWIPAAIALPLILIMAIALGIIEMLDT